jgi:hypothetical protein
MNRTDTNIEHVCSIGHVTKVAQSEIEDRSESFILCPVCRHQAWGYQCSTQFGCMAPVLFTNCITREENTAPAR